MYVIELSEGERKGGTMFPVKRRFPNLVQFAFPSIFLFCKFCQAQGLSLIDRFQSLYHFIGQETLAITDDLVNAFRCFNKLDHCMDVVGHHNISDQVMLMGFEVVEPRIHCIISLNAFDKVYPPIAGEGEEEQSLTERYCCFNRHKTKLGSYATIAR